MSHLIETLSVLFGMLLTLLPVLLTALLGYVISTLSGMSLEWAMCLTFLAAIMLLLMTTFGSISDRIDAIHHELIQSQMSREDPPSLTKKTHRRT